MRINFSPRHILLAVIGLIFVGYCLFQARFIILGPRVYIESPKDGEIVQNAVIQIKGEAYNTAWISLNGEQIYTDADGRWEELLLVSTGTSIMTVSVRDRFGRERTENVRIILK